jgi:hypothetical protein
LLLLEAALPNANRCASASVAIECTEEAADTTRTPWHRLETTTSKTAFRGGLVVVSSSSESWVWGLVLTRSFEAGVGPTRPTLNTGECRLLARGLAVVRKLVDEVVGDRAALALALDVGRYLGYGAASGGPVNEARHLWCGRLIDTASFFSGWRSHNREIQTAVLAEVHAAGNRWCSALDLKIGTALYEALAETP